MKIYKVKAPSGKVTKKAFSRALAYKVRNYWNAKFDTDKFEVIVYAEGINHDHELTKIDTKSYVITHYEVTA